MKKMILVALVAGSATAFIQHNIQASITKQRDEQLLANLMLSPPQEERQDIQVPVQSPMGGDAQNIPPTASLEQLPPGAVPLDLERGPGTIDEKGSARPEIRIPHNWLQKLLPQPAARPSASLLLTKTKETIKTTKDPIWQLQLVTSDGQVLSSLPALTGRSYRQSADRHQAGNKSPLPKGTYSIDRYGIARAPFSDPELGQGYWVPITPLFSTGRSALGFHQDPSWGKNNGESGTSGCIGLENKQATTQLVEWIKHFNITKLTVNS